MDAIFLDTNSIRNEKASSFFGNIDTYQRIANQVQIIIPTMVIEEIKRQKKRHLKSQFDKFKANYFSTYIGIDPNDELECKNHIDDRIAELYSGANEEIPHIEYDLEEKDNLLKIKKLAIKNIAPFEKQTDKGFKDTFIYLTVLQYQETASDDVFILTNDTRLKEAFKDDNVTVLSSVDEYYNYYREEYFKGDYFIGRIKEYTENENIEAKDILGTSISDDDDWIIKVEVENEEINLLVDFYSKEIIETL